MARLYGALLEPDRLLSTDLLAEATSPQSRGLLPDPARGRDLRPRVQADDAAAPFGPNPRSFGHFGTGGAVGFADPDAGVAFGYVMNDVIPRWQSTRNRSLVDAVYERVVVPGTSRSPGGTPHVLASRTGRARPETMHRTAPDRGRCSNVPPQTAAHGRQT